MRKTMAALLVAVLAVFTLAPAASADEQARGFHAKVTGQVTFRPATDPSCAVPPGSPMQTLSAGWGTAAHLGRVEMDSLHCSGDAIAGTMHLVGARGSVTLGYRGNCTPFPPPGDLITCDLSYAVTGGSGAFAGAEGEGQMMAYVAFPADALDPFAVPWTAEWVLKGWISY